MKTYTIIAGLNDRYTKKQEISTDNASALISTIILKYTAGATLSTCKGIYKHEDNGQIIFETSIKIEIAGIRKQAAKQIASEIKAALNQESIYFAVSKSQVKFL